MKLQELDKRYEAAAKARKQLENDVELLQHNIDALNNQAMTLATAGNVEDYKRKRNEVVNLEAELFVKRAQLKANASPVSAEEVKDAWKNYAADRNKQLDDMLAKYRTHKKALAAEYRDMIEYQAETLANRERCAQYLGINTAMIDGLVKTADGEMHDLPVKTLPTSISSQLTYRGSQTKDDNLKFFYADGEFTDTNGAFERDHRIVTLHRP